MVVRYQPFIALMMYVMQASAHQAPSIAWSLLLEVYNRTHYTTTDPANGQRALDKAAETAKADVTIYGIPKIRNLIRCNRLAQGGYLEAGHAWAEALAVYSEGEGGGEEELVASARCLVQLGRGGEALEKLTSSGIETAAVVGMKGWCAYHGGKVSEAIVLLEKATGHDPRQGYHLGEGEE